MLHNDGGVDLGSTVSGPGYLLPVSELISDRYQSPGSLKALSAWANSLGGPPQGYLVFQAVEKHSPGVRRDPEVDSRLWPVES